MGLEKEISRGHIVPMKESLSHIKTVFARYPDFVGAEWWFWNQAKIAVRASD